MQLAKNGSAQKALVAPSVLAADFAALAGSCMPLVNAGAKVLHVDIMDGHFVPNISMGVPVVAAVHKALPGVFLDVHLMLENPLKYIPAFSGAGAGLISFHIEAAAPIEETLNAIHGAGKKAGLVIKPATPVAAVLPYLNKVELVLVMAVEPGFGGQAFMPAAIDKLVAIKKAAQAAGLTHLLVEVDGGVDQNTAPKAVAAGANLLVAGSAVFGAKDPVAAFTELSNISLCAGAPLPLPF